MRTRTIFIAMVLLLVLPESGAGADRGQGELRVHADRRGRTLVLEVGPVDLPADVGYGAAIPPIGARGTWPVDGWLRSFSMELVGADGGHAPGARVHHAALFAPDERNVFDHGMRRVVAFGLETAPIRLPGELGYRIRAGDSLAIGAALFNPTDEPQPGVVLRLVMTYADARLDSRRQDVLPIYLDAVPHGQITFDAAPGETRQSTDWTPAVSGRILGLGGHLHQHGASLILEDVTEGEVLWVGEGEYDEGGKLTGVSREFFHRGLPIHAGRLYRITAVYRNPTGQTIGGAMGHVAGVLLPDDLDDLPGADRSHPDYEWDVYGIDQGHAQHHAHHHGAAG